MSQPVGRQSQVEDEMGETPALSKRPAGDASQAEAKARLSHDHA
jgi:hypothetical protein